MTRNKLARFAYRVTLLLVAAAIFAQCRPDVSIEHEQAAEGMGTDSLAITSFNVERENKLRPADWKVYETGREVIAAPSNWTAHLKGIDLIIMPPSSADSSERLVFNRYQKNSSTIDYDHFAQQLASKAFGTFRVAKDDTLKKIELAKHFFYERTGSLTKQGIAYKGYHMVYVNDSLVYQFDITLTKARLSLYQGELINDIVSNLQINHQYVVRNSNPIKEIIYIKR